MRFTPHWVDPRRVRDGALLVLRVAPTLVRLRIILDHDGFAAAKAYSVSLGGRSRSSLVSAQTMAVVVHRIAGLAPKRLSCLPRSLTLWAVAKSAGHDVQVLLGAAPRAAGQQLEAHAWVELDGVALGERSVGRYVPLRLDDHRLVIATGVAQ